MQFTEVVITTTTAGIDPVTGSLMQLGVNGFVIEDKEDFQEFLQSTTPHWDYIDDALMARADADTVVKVYVADNAQGAEQLAAIRSELERLRRFDTEGAFGALTLSLSQVAEEDWANNWKQYFKPFPVGKRFLVRPLWEHPDNPDGRIVLSLDPGSAFGSGQHHTTQLCLALLEDCVRPGDAVLDMGCGSGILGIAAAQLGAGRVLCVDIEQNAVQKARDNWAQNPTDAAFDTLCGDVLSDPAACAAVSARQYDVVVANIVADVLIAMAPLFRRWLRPGGTLLVSGILAGRAQEVIDALTGAGFASDLLRAENDWAAARLLG